MFRVYRNYIGFVSGVLGGFCRVLPGFVFLLLMRIGEVLLGGLGLFWYLSGLRVFLGTLQAMLLPYLCTVKDERVVARAARNEMHTISIYPGLEGLGFRVSRFGFRV